MIPFSSDLHSFSRLPVRRGASQQALQPAFPPILRRAATEIDRVAKAARYDEELLERPLEGPLGSLSSLNSQDSTESVDDLYEMGYCSFAFLENCDPNEMMGWQISALKQCHEYLEIKIACPGPHLIKVLCIKDPDLFMSNGFIELRRIEKLLLLLQDFNLTPKHLQGVSHIDISNFGPRNISLILEGSTLPVWLPPLLTVPYGDVTLYCNGLKKIGFKSILRACFPEIEGREVRIQMPPLQFAVGLLWSYCKPRSDCLAGIVKEADLSRYLPHDWLYFLGQAPSWFKEATDSVVFWERVLEFEKLMHRQMNFLTSLLPFAKAEGLQSLQRVIESKINYLISHFAKGVRPIDAERLEKLMPLATSLVIEKFPQAWPLSRVVRECRCLKRLSLILIAPFDLSTLALCPSLQELKLIRGRCYNEVTLSLSSTRPLLPALKVLTLENVTLLFPSHLAALSSLESLQIKQPELIAEEFIQSLPHLVHLTLNPVAQPEEAEEHFPDNVYVIQNVI